VWNHILEGFLGFKDSEGVQNHILEGFLALKDSRCTETHSERIFVLYGFEVYRTTFWKDF
jgi:hypothetical protein